MIFDDPIMGEAANAFIDETLAAHKDEFRVKYGKWYKCSEVLPEELIKPTEESFVVLARWTNGLLTLEDRIMDSDGTWKWPVCGINHVIAAFMLIPPFDE